MGLELRQYSKYPWNNHIVDNDAKRYQDRYGVEDNILGKPFWASCSHGITQNINPNVVSIAIAVHVRILVCGGSIKNCLLPGWYVCRSKEFIAVYIEFIILKTLLLFKLGKCHQ